MDAIKVTWKDTRRKGFPEYLAGTKYVRMAANLVAERGPDELVSMKWVYGEVAQAYGTTYQSVERAIRTAIAKTEEDWDAREAIFELAADAWERQADMERKARVCGRIT